MNPSRLQLASETYGGLEKDKILGFCFSFLPSSPWESRCEDCACSPFFPVIRGKGKYDTLVQYAAYWLSFSAVAVEKMLVSFDSDYSGGDDASPLFSPQVSLLLAIVSSY